MSRYNRERDRRIYESDRWRDQQMRRESQGGYGSLDDEDRGFWDRTTDEVRSWFGNEEAERRRRADEMRREREPEWQWRGRTYNRDYGRNYIPDRYGSNAENTWNSGRRYGEESEDWRYLDDYWSTTYGDRYPNRAEYSGRRYPERQQSSYGDETFGGLGGPTDWMYDQGLQRGRNYIGKGPRNYKRSDDWILEDINEQLTRHPAIDATEIEVTIDDGDVILRGVVESRSIKRRVEDLAENVSGVKNVRNELRIQDWSQKNDNRAA